MTELAIAGIVLVALALSAAAGAPVIGWALRRIEPGAQTPGILRGGMWVGVLERLMVTGSILVGHPEAIAVVVAVKGLGRYPELRDTVQPVRGEVSERFIIGTFASLLWSGLLGIAGRLAIGAV
ncbi:hypothetical protein [Demequina globuliformis]|uniref:hypothetical protein n=1 Tax=Demequina globuliformis TaxID=676202 RepID=UPI000783B712|nr:hypothetical protein [Demequina globuliformis]